MNTEHQRLTKPLLHTVAQAILAIVSGAAHAADQNPPLTNSTTGTVSEAPGSKTPLTLPDTHAGLRTNPLRKAYFGDLHVHTAWSFDAFIYDVRTTPDDAYRFGLGEAIDHVSGLKIKLSKPLDFMAVTDHAEYMAAGSLALEPGSVMSGIELARRLVSKDPAEARASYTVLGKSIGSGTPIPELLEQETISSVWAAAVETADRYYRPGEFTTFAGFEWTSTPLAGKGGQGRNLHRNVIFRSNNVPQMPFSSLNSVKPEELWQWMEQQREEGIDLLAIPHNGNVSDGLMYPETDSYGKPIDGQYAQTRQRNEPVNEVVQIKGQSMTHPLLSPDDSYAGFEIFEPLLGAVAEGEAPLLSQPQGSYVRQALKDGLRLGQKLGVNPFKFGVIGSSDTHNSGMPIEEDNYFGKLGSLDGTAEGRLASIDPMGAHAVKIMGAAGLAGIWAENNTRASLFDALMRKEVFATSGPRIRVRLFGGWDYPERFFDERDWLNKAYRNGVPMGQDLPPRPPSAATTAQTPTFLLWALKDPDGTNLERLQLIKGWTKDGKTYEKVYDVALGSEAAPGMATTVGADELISTWTDPDFDPNVAAFYYARVLELPSPRWSTYDAKQLGIEVPKELPVNIQERAWTSAIWYEPNPIAQQDD